MKNLWENTYLKKGVHRPSTSELLRVAPGCIPGSHSRLTESRKGRIRISIVKSKLSGSVTHRRRRTSIQDMPKEN